MTVRRESCALPARTPAARQAIEDPVVRRRIRRQDVATGILALSGVVLLLGPPLLEVLAHHRERSYESHADLVRGTAVAIGEKEVTFEYGEGINAHRVTVPAPQPNHFAAGFSTVALLVDHADPSEGRLAGEEYGFLPAPLRRVHQYGWWFVLPLFGVAAGIRLWTAYTARILRIHPWRPITLRRDPAFGLLVGDLDGTTVAYRVFRPKGGHAEVAGPTVPKPGQHSVLRFPPSGRLRRAAGPLRYTSTSEAAAAAGALVDASTVISTVTSWRRHEQRAATEHGEALAEMQRGQLVVDASGPSGEMLFALRGHGRGVAVFDHTRALSGTIDFRFRRTDVLVGDRERPLAIVRYQDRRHDVIVGPQDDVLGNVEYAVDLLGRHQRAAISLAGWLPEADRRLILIAALTARWRPWAQGGG